MDQLGLNKSCFFFPRISETPVLHSLGNIQLSPAGEYCIHHLDVKALQISQRLL